MTIATWVQFAALVVALLSLIWQQQKTSGENERKEKRIETKLRIFYDLSLTEKDLEEGAIISALEGGQPLREADKVEVRKALYEMLSDETIRFTSDKKYKPRQRSPRNDGP
ncbi:hypothetical protein WL67_15670 [Burkholderia ubonensis]|uniref:hypothetical protein n=1 Tax=Burkholderia ubonensis TaxID=101571 RepID=UPI0007539A7A|nr:hypothetical protein [Burkholderia ubonensis]KWD48834.1 hypothetical protein WL66_21340 [Burkholderia ubonensis]KWD53623.1 hypothetical protein WL67_15670 [Burkholderia ubonensis]